jgi:hypothetical protein
MEHLPCNESLEKTHDLGFAAPFFQLPRRIGLGLLVPTQAYDNDAIERCIGLAVASAIERNFSLRPSIIWSLTWQGPQEPLVAPDPLHPPVGVPH